jgi:uncharacterized protein involved in type VI secretion and phage assembly
MNGDKQFYGKYRGVVTDNQDPLLLGRIKAKIQDVLADKECGWALPCTPYGGKGVGLFLVPPKDAFVWIEFEHGDTEYPIWTGCFWAQDEMPVKPAVPEKKVLKTDVVTITLDDTKGAGGITIETTDGMKIVINSQEIEINNGQNANIKLNSNTVSINGNALEVS